MISSPLISIVIPTYNRYDYLGETLDSIIAQTYTNWECIIVDDGSTDKTEMLLGDYMNKDGRFIFLKRPFFKPKGANSCRNIGLSKAIGDYVMFFDSDDLMTVNHLAVKLNSIVDSNYDVVITKTKYFNNDKLNVSLSENYNFSDNDISVINYISHKVNWLTYDTLIRINLAKSIDFNEELSSGQEYNYYCKLVLLTEKINFVPEIVTLRRYLPNSIRGSLLNNDYKKKMGYFRVYWATFKDIKGNAPSAALRFLLYRCFRISREIKITNVDDLLKFYWALIKSFGLRGLGYILVSNFYQIKLTEP